jgi:hypothetical protein
MPMGTRHCVTGLLKRSARGLLLELDGGGIYALDAPAGAKALLGLRVTVEGVRTDFDRLDVEWIERAKT